MKIFNRYKLMIASGLLSTLLVGAGCKKTLDINQNPNFPASSQGSPSLVFPVGVLATTGMEGGQLAIVGGMWSQYFTQAANSQQYTDVDSYNLPNSDGFITIPWDVLFPGLKNYQYVIQSADSLKDWNYYLMGTVMKAYTTALLVDLFDQIPYSQSLQGIGNLNPKFDDGYSVYTSLINSIDVALGKDFTATTNSVIGAQDLVFGGTMDNWKAFANTLKLKMYLRMINAHPDVAQAGIAALYNNKAKFLDNTTGGASVTNFKDAPGLDNPFYEQNIRQLNTTTNIRASVTFVSWLQANSDPRVNYFFGTNPPGPILAINQGDFRNNSPNNANANVFNQSPLDPVDFISLAESYFLQAEADVRYFGGTKAKALYNAGVSAAFAATTNDASTFIASGGAYEWGNEVENGAKLDPIQQIIRQKWASFAYGCHGIEAFFDHNRTGYPLQSPVYSTDPAYVPGQWVVAINSILDPGTFPKRLIFPYDETSRNTNAPATVPITTAVWWSK